MLHNGDMYFNCSFNLLSWWMFLLFKLITQHMWDMSIFIASACWVYLTPLFSSRLLMMNVGMKGMGLAAPLALLYHHKIIAESRTNKDDRCYLLYLKVITLHLSFPCICTLDILSRHIGLVDRCVTCPICWHEVFMHEPIIV